MQGLYTFSNFNLTGLGLSFVIVIFSIFLAIYVNLLLSGEDPSIGMPDKLYQSKYVVYKITPLIIGDL